MDMLRRFRGRKIHPESLLRIPLVEQALTDPQVGMLQPRAIDMNWYYRGVISKKVTGFNPMTSRAMYAKVSKLALWLKQTHASPRDLNSQDHLIREVLSMAHDYLHAWSYRAIRSLLPRIGFGSRPIDEKNFEDFVFCHLVTEAVATVGLDYWLLCEKGVNAHCEIGSTIGALTVSYSESNLYEYRRFNPSFEAQTPHFFSLIAEFYCTGDFVGFNVRDVSRSPLLLSWLDHEIEYGDLQRHYTRSWLNHLAVRRQDLTVKRLHAPVNVSTPWKRSLLRNLGEMLWEKVKMGKLHDFAPFDPGEAWQSPKNIKPDFRLLNLNVYDQDEERLPTDIENLHADNQLYYLYQLLSRYQFDQFESTEIDLVRSLVGQKDIRSLQTYLRGRKRVKAVESEPSDIMFFN